MVLRERVISGLNELADRDFQLRVWLGFGRPLPDGHHEMSSFIEAVCRLFDDSGLRSQWAEGDVAFSAPIDDRLKLLLEKLQNMKEPGLARTKAGLLSNEMESLRQDARSLLDLLTHPEAGGSA